jgi:quercetin dioxygenase-like cupin family protein
MPRPKESDVHISRLEDIPATEVTMPGAALVRRQVPISRDHGAPTFSFRVFTIEPGGHTPLHSHPSEHANYIIDGSGAVVTPQGERPVRKGDFVLVLPHETHQYKNTSAHEPMVMICAVPKEYE